MQDKNGKDKRFKKQNYKNEGKLLNKDGHNKKTKKERSTEERKYKEKIVQIYGRTIEKNIQKSNIQKFDY